MVEQDTSNILILVRLWDKKDCLNILSIKYTIQNYTLYWERKRLHISLTKRIVIDK